jgi:hypothetical protein
MLKGPTGCGKTRFVEAMAYRLGRPLVTVACHEDLSATIWSADTFSKAKKLSGTTGR